MQYLKFHEPIWNWLDLDNDYNAISDVWSITTPSKKEIWIYLKVNFFVG